MIPNDVLRNISGGAPSVSNSQVLHMHIYPTPGMTAADARRTGRQMGAAALSEMSRARKAGFG